MPNGDPMIPAVTAPKTQETYVGGGDVVGQTVQKKTSFWGKVGNIIGGVAKVGAGVLTGGFGSVLPGLIGGAGSYMGSIDTMLNAGKQNAVQLLFMQQRVYRQNEEFSALTNLLKARHDSEMTAVNNLKS